MLQPLASLNSPRTAATEAREKHRGLIEKIEACQAIEKRWGERGRALAESHWLALPQPDLYVLSRLAIGQMADEAAIKSLLALKQNASPLPAHKVP